MRWPNGGPPKLYALVVNATGDVLTFDRKQKRTAWLVDRHKIRSGKGAGRSVYLDGTYTFLTYVQQEK